MQQGQQNPYAGLRTLDDVYNESPDLFNAASSRFHELSRFGADRGMIQREAQRLGIAPIATDPSGNVVDLTDFVARRADMSVGEHLQDVVAGVGRNIASLPADVASLASIPLQAATGYTGVADFANRYRQGINEMIPTSNKYRESTAEMVGQGIGSVATMMAGGAGLTKLGIGAASAVAAGEAAQAAAKAAQIAKNAMRIATIQGAGSEAGAAQAAGAGVGAQLLAAGGGAAAAQLEKFGAEKIITELMSPAMKGARYTGMRAVRDVAGGFAGEIGEEFAAAPLTVAGRSGYEQAPFGERLQKELAQTAVVAPLAILPFSAVHGIKASSMVRRDTQLANALPDIYSKRTGSLAELSKVEEGQKLERKVLTMEQLRESDPEAADELEAISTRAGTPMNASSPSTQRVAALGEMLSQSGVRVAYFEPQVKEGEEPSDVSGFYDPNTSTVYVNSALPENAQIMQGLVHEVMHDLHKDSPGGLAQLHERLKAAFGKTYTDYMERVAKTYGEYEEGSQNLTEEHVNNFLTQGMGGYLGLAFTNQDVFKMASYNDPGLLSTVAETFSRFMGLSIDKYNQRDQAILTQRLENIASELGGSFMADPNVGKIDPNTAIRVANEVVLGMQSALEIRGSMISKIRQAIHGSGTSGAGKAVVGPSVKGGIVIRQNRARALSVGALSKEDMQRLYPEGYNPPLGKDVVATESSTTLPAGTVIAKAGEPLTSELIGKIKAIPRGERTAVEYSKEDVLQKLIDRVIRVDRIPQTALKQYKQLGEALKGIEERGARMPAFESAMSPEDAAAARSEQAAYGEMYMGYKRKAEKERRAESEAYRKRKEQFEKDYAEEEARLKAESEAREAAQFEEEYAAVLAAEEAQRKAGMDDAHAKALLYIASRRHILKMKAELYALQKDAERQGRGNNEPTLRQLQLEYAVGEYYKLERTVKELFKGGFEVDTEAPPSVTNRKYDRGGYKLGREFAPKPGETELQTEVRLRELSRSQEISSEMKDLEQRRNRILNFLNKARSTGQLSNELASDPELAALGERLVLLRDRALESRRRARTSNTNLVKRYAEEHTKDFEFVANELEKKAAQYRRRWAELNPKRRESRQRAGFVEPPPGKRKGPEKGGEEPGMGGPTEPEGGPPEGGPPGGRPLPPEAPTEGGIQPDQGQQEQGGAGTQALTAEEVIAGDQQQTQQQPQRQEEPQAQTAEEAISGTQPQQEQQAQQQTAQQQPQQPAAEQQTQEQDVTRDDSGNWQPGAAVGRIVRGGVPDGMTVERARSKWVSLQADNRRLLGAIRDAAAKGKYKGRYRARLDNLYGDNEKSAAQYSNWHWALTGKQLDGPAMSEEMNALVDQEVGARSGREQQQASQQVRRERKPRTLERKIRSLLSNPNNQSILRGQLAEVIGDQQANDFAKKAPGMLARYLVAYRELAASKLDDKKFDEQTSRALGEANSEAEFNARLLDSLAEEYLDSNRRNLEITEYPGLKESGILAEIDQEELDKYNERKAPASQQIVQQQQAQQTAQQPAQQQPAQQQVATQQQPEQQPEQQTSEQEQAASRQEGGNKPKAGARKSRSPRIGSKSIRMQGRSVSQINDINESNLGSQAASTGGMMRLSVDGFWNTDVQEKPLTPRIDVVREVVTASGGRFSFLKLAAEEGLISDGRFMVRASEADSEKINAHLAKIRGARELVNINGDVDGPEQEKLVKQYDRYLDAEKPKANAVLSKFKSNVNQDNEARVVAYFDPNSELLSNEAKKSIEHEVKRDPNRKLYLVKTKFNASKGSFANDSDFAVFNAKYFEAVEERSENSVLHVLPQGDAHVAVFVDKTTGEVVGAVSSILPNTIGDRLTNLNSPPVIDRRGESLQPSRLMSAREQLARAELPNYERTQEGVVGWLERAYTGAVDRFEAVRAIERNIAKAADQQAKNVVDENPDAPNIERAVYNSSTMNVSEMLDLYTGRIGENNKLAMEQRDEMVAAAKEHNIPVAMQENEGEAGVEISADGMLYASHAVVANQTLLEDNITEEFKRSERGVEIKKKVRSLESRIRKEMRSDDVDEDLISELENQVGDLMGEQEDTIKDMVNEALARPSKIKEEMRKLKAEKPASLDKQAEINTRLNDLSMQLEAAERAVSLSGMTNEQARKINAKVAASPKLAGYKRIRSAMTKIQDLKLQIMVDAQLVDPSTVAKWKARYGSTYIPLKSTIRDPDGSSFSGGGGISIRGKETKARRGRSDYADDIIAHALVDFSQANSRANRNHVSRTLFSLIEANRDNTNWTWLGSDLRKAKASGLYNVRDKERLISVKTTQIKKGGGTKTVEVYAVVHSEDMARAVRQLDGIDLGNFTAGAVYATRLFTRMQTAWNPAFILPNFVRDMALATGVRYADSGVKAAARMLKNIPAAVRTILAVELGQDMIGRKLGAGRLSSGKFARQYQEMKNLGGFSSPVDYGTVEEQMKRFKKEAANLPKSKLGTVSAPPVSAIKAFFGFIEAINTVAERATRLAAYVEMDETMSEYDKNHVPGDMKVKRAAAAKNMTVNFDRRGTAGPMLNSLYAFYNANVQGTANLIRKLGPNAPKETRIRSGIAVSAFALAGYTMSMLARAMGDDDDEGEEAYKAIGVDELQKSAILMIPGGGDNRITMPLPWGANMAWFMGVQMERLAAGDIKPTEASDQYVAGLLNSFSPITGPTVPMAMLPTIARPFAEIDSNMNYAGNAIMPPVDPYDKTPLPDSRRSFRTVGGHYKMVAETLNDITGGSARTSGFIDISPESLEHIGEFMSGGVGRFVSNSVGMDLNKEDPKMRDIPVVGPIAGRFVRQSDAEQRTISEFYSNAAKVAMWREDIKDPETRQEAMDSGLGGVSRYATAVESRIRKLREAEVNAANRGDSEMSKRLKSSRLDIMQSFNRRYNQIATK